MATLGMAPWVTSISGRAQAVGSIGYFQKGTTKNLAGFEGEWARGGGPSTFESPA
jgi:hypothetical protein